jgi:hypothetical protein
MCRESEFRRQIEALGIVPEQGGPVLDEAPGGGGAVPRAGGSVRGLAIRHSSDDS